MKDGETYKLADFGVSKLEDETVEQSLVGTEGYMAPEVLQEDKYNQSADIWSLGCVLVNFCCQKAPFEKVYKDIPKANHREIPDNYSYELKNLISYMLKITPGERIPV